ncbi:voltage-dependent calcium channel type A subunit alpha-1-like [Liolophura sinensis]|uniref:voltage-dependent calcium channel type A subunit alpha-1-like n=1 Tax=Liolophura sinensis TaxID=3198878 RepID=UPI003159422E
MEEWTDTVTSDEEATNRLRYKARTMIGAAGSRHMSQRRRASLATTTLHPSYLSHLEQVAEGRESGRRPAAPRRRAVDTSDYRTCAILQTRLKTMKHYPEISTFSSDGCGRDDADYTTGADGSLRHVARKAANLSLPGVGPASTRSLFIFSEENFIRKYAKIIIEWGYPFCQISLFFQVHSFIPT